MPRIPPRQFWQARHIHKSLVNLLPICRDLRSAQNELRWLTEHAVELSKHSGHIACSSILAHNVRRRTLGEPLQYILGSEYFGNLEIKCRSGVLIPRQETADAVIHLVSLLNGHGVAGRPGSTSFRVLDLCTGTGCIPLLFHNEFYPTPEHTRQLEIIGVDISPEALSLARENLIHQISHQAHQYVDQPQRLKSLRGIGFVSADVMKSEDDGRATEANISAILPALQRVHMDGSPPSFDVLLCNPPYISPKEFERTTSRSVTQFEPKLALVPAGTHHSSDTEIGDSFYPRLFQIAKLVNAKVCLFEVADLEQAKRVASIAVTQEIWAGIEIWRAEPQGVRTEHTELEGRQIVVKGSGNGRTVLVYRSEAANLFEKQG